MLRHLSRRFLQDEETLERSIDHDYLYQLGLTTMLKKFFGGDSMSRRTCKLEKQICRLLLKALFPSLRETRMFSTCVPLFCKSKHCWTLKETGAITLLLME